MSIKCYMHKNAWKQQQKRIHSVCNCIQNAADCICVWRVVNCSVTLRRVYYILCTLPGVPLMLSTTPQCAPSSQLYRRENWGAEMTALLWAWRLVRRVFLLPPPCPDACGLLVAVDSWFVRQSGSGLGSVLFSQNYVLGCFWCSRDTHGVLKLWK